MNTGIRSNTGITIRRATDADFPAIWAIFKPLLEEGETYSYASDTSQDEGRAIWLETSIATYVAIMDDTIAGAYLIRQNRPGRGSHVANAAYIVHPDFYGKKIGRTMGLHSFDEAKRLGFVAMQYNFVVSTNKAAVHLWQSIGMKIIGTSPKSFQHKTLGLVDIHILHKFL